MMKMDQERHYEKFQGGNVLVLPCEKLRDHPLRLEFYSQAHLDELCCSIKETGVLEPVLVWEQTEGQYLILSGHYRVRAVRRLRREEILCRVLKCDRRTAHVIYCTSNLMTRGLSAIEEAHIISGLITKEGFTMVQVGKLWGRSKSWVCRRIKLLTVLDPLLKKELGQGILSPRLAQELTRLPRGNEQERVWAFIRRHHLNKDEAAQFIDWWIEAQEAERKKVETTDALPFAVNPAKEDQTVGNDRNPGLYVSTLIKRCVVIIEELLTFLKKQEKPFSWWPRSCYRSFLACLDELERLCREGDKQTKKEGMTDAASLSRKT